MKPTTYSSFTIERTFAAPPSLVFQAWATMEGTNGLIDQLAQYLNPKH